MPCLVQYINAGGSDVIHAIFHPDLSPNVNTRQGYALRELKDDFLKRYNLLQPQAKDVEALVEYLSSMLGASQRDWQIGTSKVIH